MIIRCQFLLLLAGVVVMMIRAKLLVPDLYPSRYEVAGDINLGVMVQVSDNEKPVHAPHCSRLIPGNSQMKMIHVQLCELAHFAIQQINQRMDLLPNISLGMVCVDTCDEPLTALARSVYLIEDHLPDACLPSSVEANISTDDSLQNMQLKHHKVNGVVGPLSSEEAVLVSTLLGLFEIPVLGTHSTSDELSDKNNFKYFMGLAPPDRFQANALVDIAMYFNWTYIGLFYTEGSYGEYGSKQVQALVNEHGLCLAFGYKMSIRYVHREEMEILEILENHPNLKVIIWFAQGQGLLRIFKAISIRYPTPKAVYLFSYLSGYMRVVYEKATVGSFSVGPFAGNVPGFLDYFRGLVPGNNTENPWLRLRWQETFNCDWVTNSNNSCSGYRADPSWYGKFRILSPYYDATYVYGHALHRVIEENCPQAFGDKSVLEECIRGPVLLDAMKKVSFMGVFENVSFDNVGDRLAKYRVSHMYRDPQGDVQMITAGVWDRLTQSLNIFTNKLNMNFLTPEINDPRAGYHILTDDDKEMFIPYSVCSWPCGPREFRIQKSIPCCWECRECRNNEVVQNLTSCTECPEFHWPDEQQPNKCVQIGTTFLLWQDSVSVSLSSFALLGMILTSAFTFILWKNRGAKLVKASNKELSCIILLGSFLAFVMVFFFILKPTQWSCMVRQVGFHLAVNLLYSPVFVKSCRVYLIFTSGKKTVKKPRFTSDLAQRVVVIWSICGQACILLGCLIWSPPDTRLYMPVATEPYVELTCTQPMAPFLMPLTYNLIVILVCALLGYKSRKLPANFNESGFIFISVSTTLFAWLVFLPTYFTAAKSHHQMAILGLCLLINAFITLLCLFGPKVYALKYVDEQNMSIGTVITGLGSQSVSSAQSVRNVNRIAVSPR